MFVTMTLVVFIQLLSTEVYFSLSSFCSYLDFPVIFELEALSFPPPPGLKFFLPAGEISTMGEHDRSTGKTFYTVMPNRGSSTILKKN
jgi:hypothetical protein